MTCIYFWGLLFFLGFFFSLAKSTVKTQWLHQLPPSERKPRKSEKKSKKFSTCCNIVDDKRRQPVSFPTYDRTYDDDEDDDDGDDNDGGADDDNDDDGDDNNDDGDENDNGGGGVAECIRHFNGRRLHTV